MFGKILSVFKYTISIENLSRKDDSSFLGVHVVFEGKYKIVAEITMITCDIIECELVGEFIGNRFNSGITHKPNFTSNVRVVNKDEVFALVGSQEVDSMENIYLGKSLVYDGFNVSANIDNFFSNHFAILGNTGSGKSCTVARVFQNLFYRKTYIPENSRIVLFDVYGEYRSAFEKINGIGQCRYKALTTDPNAADSDLIKIPPSFLQVEDIALLLDAESALQLPII